MAATAVSATAILGNVCFNAFSLQFLGADPAAR
jgi:hypothetical protein